MAHGIFTKRDFQIAEKPAWHKLTVLETPTKEHFPELESVTMEYHTGKHRPNGEPLYSPVIIGGETRAIAIAKDDGEICGECYNPNSYTLFSPREAWDYVAGVLAGTGYTVESIGMLWNRSNWFISTRLDELKSVKMGGRETNFMLNFSGGLDKSMSPQAELSSTVVVCANTLSVSRMSGERLFKIRATKNFGDRLKETVSEVEKACGMAAIFKAEMDKLANNTCNVDRAQKVLTGFFTPREVTKASEMSTRSKNQVRQITNLFLDGIGNSGRTEFDLLNAVTELGTRGNGKNDGKAFGSGEFGGWADTKAEFASVMINPAKLQTVEERGKALLTA